MGEWHRLNTSEQFAEFLRKEILDGRWSELMPGAQRLAAEFGINQKFVAEALAILERANFLLSQGVGKSRLIQIPDNARKKNSLRVTLFLREKDEREWSLILRLQHLLVSAGYVVQFAPKTLYELKMNPKRISRMVEAIDTDLWIVVCAPRAVLEWFTAQSVPSFALMGRARNVPIASAIVEGLEVLLSVVRRLVDLGHRRIVIIELEALRKPKPGVEFSAILAELEALGIPTGPYNFPDWEETPEGLQRCLDGLFSVTPPDALLINPPSIYLSVSHYLANRGVKVPRDVSLFCMDPDPDFYWSRPGTSYLNWSQDSFLRQVMAWVRSVEKGKPSMRKSIIKAELMEGETIGPAPKRAR